MITNETIQKAARAICTDRCHARGDIPCWLMRGNNSEVLEWPPERCEPSCVQLATDAIEAVEADIRNAAFEEAALGFDAGTKTESYDSPWDAGFVAGLTHCAEEARTLKTR